MQFIDGGPDIPDALLQNHEDGKVVFFCGAGVSCKVGLCGFKELVDKIFDKCNARDFLFYEKESEMINRGELDRALDSLEKRLPSTLAVRESLWDLLQLHLDDYESKETHRALLRLSRSKKNNSDHKASLRLVTTNFDRTFEVLGLEDEFYHNTFTTPLLPIPKPSRWDGLVYLHGILPENRSDSVALENLVVTSGDFGRAYISERWASRFVSELFRFYQICFVGYSVNDPVMRYLTDAIAADNLKGERTLPVYAFVAYEEDRKKEIVREWEIRGITPIAYDKQGSHRLLHKTLSVWGNFYKDGFYGRKSIISNYASNDPRKSTEMDNFVEKVLWALSDPSGEAVKTFADLTPAPPLSWLRVFIDNKLFLTSLVSAVPSRIPLDETNKTLCRWLLRYLNDSRLVILLCELGGVLNENFVELIKNRLNEISSFGESMAIGDDNSIEKLRRDLPFAVPSPLMRHVWSIFLAGRVGSCQYSRSLTLYNWISQLKREGLTVSNRFTLRQILSPKVTFGESNYPYKNKNGEENAVNVKELVNWEMVLSATNTRYFLSHLRKYDLALWKSICFDLFDDFQSNLLDGLIMMAELGGADEMEDQSMWDLPSISPHEQNERRGSRDWTMLIELLRDSWLAIHEKFPERASRIAIDWFDRPYPTFKRLALYCAGQDQSISSTQWVDWLLADNHWWLWSDVSKRETMRLMVLRGLSLTSSSKSLLETAILDGPPREHYRTYPDSNRVDFMVWLRLSKLEISGVSLGIPAKTRLEQLVENYPEWKLTEDERDEFRLWVGRMCVVAESEEPLSCLPREGQDLVFWLKNNPSYLSLFDKDDWGYWCKVSFEETFDALDRLGREGWWDRYRWEVALRIWRDENLGFLACKKIVDVIDNMPDDDFKGLARPIVWWLDAVTEKMPLSEESIEKIIKSLISRMLKIFRTDNDIDLVDENVELPVSYVQEAINHPIGEIADVLLNIYFRDGAIQEYDFKINMLIFTELCDVSVSSFRHGRVILASGCVDFFQWDKAWTRECLLPLFDWQKNPSESKGIWQGFLRSFRFYIPLMIELKSQFLDTARHYDELGEYRFQFVRLFTSAALWRDVFPESIFSTADFSKCIGFLPQEGRDELIYTLRRTVEDADDRKEELWKDRIKPFWSDVWPKDKRFASKESSESLACLCVGVGDEFPSAKKMLSDWLLPIQDPDFIALLLNENNICSRFPIDALELLHKIVDANSWPSDELVKCLNEIIRSDSALKESDKYKGLVGYCK